MHLFFFEVTIMTFDVKQHPVKSDKSMLSCLRENIGLTENEVQALLACATHEEEIRLLQRFRSRLLEDVHKKQQSLDCLDYLIHQIRNSKI
jgi:hypothetical protein